MCRQLIMASATSMTRRPEEYVLDVLIVATSSLSSFRLGFSEEFIAPQHFSTHNSTPLWRAAEEFE